MRKITLSVSAILLSISSLCIQAAPNVANTQSDDAVVYELVWSDEFDVDGALDSTKWYHQTELPNGGSWYNGELQHYTNRTENTYVQDGIMSIVAKSESFTDQGVTKSYTSARLNSKYAFTYGKVEVRAKLPTGAGTWPAIWMLGKNITEAGAYWYTEGYGTTSWPACGEVDIMEHWGTNQNFVQSAMHTPSSSGGTVNHGGQTVATVSTDFHVYSVEWLEDKMIFSVDGLEHYTYAPSVLDDSTWPFYKEQYLLMNIAIQSSIISTFTESSMEVDYVRIYQEKSTANEDYTNHANYDVYPNPTTGTLNINAADGELVKVYNVMGQLELQTTLVAGTISIDNLETGIYLVKVNNELVRVVKE